MPNTYVALRTETVATATSSVTFSLSGISGYTDLVIVANTSTPGAYVVRFNGDSGSNYSWTRLYGNGSTAVSDRGSNTSDITSAWGGSTNNLYITNIMNYANTTTNKTILTRINDNGFVVALVGMWRNTAAITSITISNGGSNYPVGSTFSLYGIANADQGSAKATGGIITEDSQYWYHTFGASGAFIPKQALTCDYLVVAGGGGGGSTYGGGGGAGGYRTATNQSLTATTYNVTVGAGGVGLASGQANTVGNGSNSVFSTITSTGGGGGGNDVSPRNGASGGSGGGGATTTGGAGNTPSTSPSQGNNGGSGASSGNYGSGGGGGADAVGANGTTTAGGNGGAGVTTSISGYSVTYAGGGGGGTFQGGTRGTGGAGGGGNAGASGGNNVGIAGTANTGGGGGGASYQSASVNGGAGGSGIVIIRYSK